MVYEIDANQILWSITLFCYLNRNNQILLCIAAAIPDYKLMMHGMGLECTRLVMGGIKRCLLRVLMSFQVILYVI